MKVVLGLCFILNMFFSLLAQAEVSPYSGYISDVETERSQRFQEVYMYAPNAQEASLQDQIFSPLSKEFKDRYRDAFGQTDTESIVYQPTKFSNFEENRGAVLKIEEANTKRRAFAEYMTKRLIEYHVDAYMRTQPQMRPVMEFKEQIQNVKVEVNESIRMNMQYNFAGNTADFAVENPWCESRLSLEMNPSGFGPSQVLETRLWVNKNLNKQLRLNTNSTLTDGIFYGEVVRTFERLNFATIAGLSTPFKATGASLRETRYVMAFVHSW